MLALSPLQLLGLVATGHYRASGVCGKCTETTEGANQTRKVDSARWVGHLIPRTPLMFGGVPTNGMDMYNPLGCVAYVTRILVCGWRMEREKGV